MSDRVVTLSDLERHKADELSNVAGQHEERRAQSDLKQAVKLHGQKLGSTNLPEPDPGLNEDDQFRAHWIVSLINDAPFPEAGKAWNPQAVFYQQYNNEDDLADHFREMLQSALRSNSPHRQRAYALLHGNASVIQNSVNLFKIEEEILGWARAGYQGEEPRKYYTIKGDEKPARDAVANPDFAMSWPGEGQLKQDQPALPNLEKYREPWRECTAALLLLFDDLNLYQEKTENASNNDEVGNARGVLLAANARIQDLQKEDNCLECDLQAPTTLMMITILESKLSSTADTEELKTKHAEHSTAYLNMLEEKVRQNHLPMAWLAETREARTARADETWKLDPKARKLIEQDFHDSYAKKNAPKQSQYATLEVDPMEIDKDGGVSTDAGASGQPGVDAGVGQGVDPGLRAGGGDKLLARLQKKKNPVPDHIPRKDADGKTDFGQVMWVRVEPRGIVALNIGTPRLPILKVMTRSQMGGFLAEWTSGDKFGWPTNDKGYCRGVLDRWEVAKSLATQRRDGKKTGKKGDKIRRPDTYFLVMWSDERGGEIYNTVISRSALAKKYNGGIDAVDGRQTKKARRLRAENIELLGLCLERSINPETSKPFTSDEEKQEMPWLWHKDSANSDDDESDMDDDEEAAPREKGERRSKKYKFDESESEGEERDRRPGRKYSKKYMSDESEPEREKRSVRSGRKYSKKYVSDESESEREERSVRSGKKYSKRHANNDESEPERERRSERSGRRRRDKHV